MRPSAAEQKGGLAIPTHPSLQQLAANKDAGSITGKRQNFPINIPKANFATIKANQRVSAVKKEIKLLEAPNDFTDVTKNPYYDPNLAAPTTAKKRSAKREFQFARHGRFMEEAEKLRSQVYYLHN